MSSKCSWLRSITRSWRRWDAHRSGKIDASPRKFARVWFDRKDCKTKQQFHYKSGFLKIDSYLAGSNTGNSCGSGGSDGSVGGSGGSGRSGGGGSGGGDSSTSSSSSSSGFIGNTELLKLMHKSEHISHANNLKEVGST